MDGEVVVFGVEVEGFVECCEKVGVPCFEELVGDFCVAEGEV